MNEEKSLHQQNIYIYILFRFKKYTTRTKGLKIYIYIYEITYCKHTHVFLAQ